MASEFERCSDEELARETQAGSLAAFEELVYRYEDRIYRFAVNSCRNATDAREVTQDTFVRAFQAIGRFDCGRGFGPWLFTIARRKCVDCHRAATSAAGEPMPEPRDENDPAVLLARREEQQDLWGLARRRLPEAQYQALWLKYAEEMSVAGIAQVLGKTRTHVKVLLFRARQVLGRELQAAGARAPTGVQLDTAARPRAVPGTLRPRVGTGAQAACALPANSDALRAGDGSRSVTVGRSGSRAALDRKSRVAEFPSAVVSSEPGGAGKGVV